MGIGAKIFSSILCKRLFKIIKQHGVKYQFGSSPGVGCQDGTFTIKTLLHTRHNHNLPSYVPFIDLVKSFNTVNHIMILNILERYGASHQLCNSIKRMYQDLKVVLKIGKVQRSYESNGGVSQGNCMAPVLFMFMVMVSAKLLEKEWDKARLNMIELQQHTHSPMIADSSLTTSKTSYRKGIRCCYFVCYTLTMDHLHLPQENN